MNVNVLHKIKEVESPTRKLSISAWKTEDWEE